MTSTETTEQEFLENLQAFLEGGDVNADEPEFWERSGIKSVRTYEDAGMLTHNRGLVVTLVNGSQFQVTIVKSR
jgi:hypothetical protein